MKQRQTLGYSLSELLVVIAIIVVLGAVFVPGLDSLRSRPTLVAAISKLEDLIISARTIATSTGRISTMVQIGQNGLVELYQVDQQIAGCPGVVDWGVPELSLAIDGVVVGGAQMARNLCFSINGLVLQNGTGFPVRYEVTRGADEYSYRLSVWQRSGSVQREQRQNQGAPWALLP